MFRFMRYSLGLCLSVCMVSESFAIGGANIGNEVPSARAAGAGYVGVAGQNEDPSAVYVNPGAITRLKGTQATVGMTWENLHGTYESDSGAKTHMKSQDVAIPNFSMTQSLMDGKMGIGLTVQSPYGLETHWAGDSPMRYVSTNSRLSTLVISPVVAYQIHPMVSIGGGPDYINLPNAQLERHLNVDAINYSLFTNGGFGAITTGSPDGIASLRGQGATWGYHGGILVEPSEQHAVGLTYHSKARIRANGHVQLSNLTGGTAAVFGGSSYNTAAYTDVVLPSNVQMGYAFKPTATWMVETNAAWYHWSEERDLNVRYAETNATRLALLNQGNPANFNLRDAWSFNVGTNYKATDRLQVRTGFWYEPWALPEQNFNPAFLDLSRYGATAGLGYGFTENLMVDFAYNAIFFHNRSIHNSVGTSASGVPATGIPSLGVPSPDIDGTYKDFVNLVAINFTYRFGGR